MTSITRFLSSASAAILIVAMSFASSSPRAGAPPPTPLFGAKPELYLSPTFGNPGDRIRILGLGLHPGATVYLVFMPAQAPQPDLAEIRHAIKAHARVPDSGVFRATYRVGPDMDPGGAASVIYLAFATYDGNPRTLLAHKLAGTAFVVCALCLSR